MFAHAKIEPLDTRQPHCGVTFLDDTMSNYMFSANASCAWSCLARLACSGYHCISADIVKSAQIWYVTAWLSPHCRWVAAATAALCNATPNMTFAQPDATAWHSCMHNEYNSRNTRVNQKLQHHSLPTAYPHDGGQQPHTWARTLSCLV